MLLFTDLEGQIDDNPTWGDANPVQRGTIYMCVCILCAVKLVMFNILHFCLQNCQKSILSPCSF